MTQVIRLKVNFPEYRIKSIRMDNATEFLSRAFNDYCMAQGIKVQHSIPYVHTQVSCSIELIGSPTIMYEDNIACVAQMQSGYVKSIVIKHITVKLFYPHELKSMMRLVSCKSSDATI
jgi:hypothetical protein